MRIDIGFNKNKFQDIHGKKVDIVDFCNKTATQGSKIYIGTDSVMEGRITTFYVVLAIRFGNSGATFVYNKFITPMFPNKKMRLQAETEVTMDFVAFLEENYVVVDVVEFDYNRDARHFSNEVLNAARGWAEGCGYKTSFKPDEQVAVKAADHLC